jgi:hypothetical protein
MSNEPIGDLFQDSFHERNHFSSSPLRRSDAFSHKELERNNSGSNLSNIKGMGINLELTVIKEGLNDYLLIDVNSNHPNVRIRANTKPLDSRQTFSKTWRPLKQQTQCPFRPFSSFKDLNSFDRQEEDVFERTPNKSEENVDFRKHKARPIDTVLGKPRTEEYPNYKIPFNREPNIRSRRSPLPPNIMIEQFGKHQPLEPRTQRSGKGLSKDQLTPWFYHRMPEIFKKAHPLASCGGILSPKRANAPPDLSSESEESIETDRQQNQFIPQDLTENQSLSPYSKRGLSKDQLTPWFYHQMPEMFKKAHPLASCGGILSPKRANAPPDLSPEPQEPNEFDSSYPKDQFTSPYYYQMPQAFRDAHPLVSGGGIATPPRIGAPKSISLEELNATNTSDTGLGEDQLTPWFYHQMPELFKRAHPLAPCGGILSPERANAPPDYSLESQDEEIRPKTNSFPILGSNQMSDSLSPTIGLRRPQSIESLERKPRSTAIRVTIDQFRGMSPSKTRSSHSSLPNIGGSSPEEFRSNPIVSESPKKEKLSEVSDGSESDSNNLYPIQRTRTIISLKKRAKSLKNSEEKSTEKSITQENTDKTSDIGMKASQQKANLALLHRSNAKMQLNDSVLRFNQKEEEVEKAKPKELFE